MIVEEKLKKEQINLDSAQLKSKFDPDAKKKTFCGPCGADKALEISKILLIFCQLVVKNN